MQIRRLFRLAPTALVSALFSRLALGAFWGLLPLLAGALMTLLRPQWIFVWFAVLNGLLASYALYHFNRRKREVTPDDNFAPLVNTTPRSLELRPAHGASGNQKQSRDVGNQATRDDRGSA